MTVFILAVQSGMQNLLQVFFAASAMAGIGASELHPYTVKKSVDFTVKYLTCGCQFTAVIFRASTCRTFLKIKIW